MNPEIFIQRYHAGLRAPFPRQRSRNCKPGRKSKAQRHTLIAAPTGSGKTLAAFLSAIDDLVRLGVQGQLDNTTHVIYVSPLKALSNDVQRNLQLPLVGIQAELKAMGLPDINIRTLVRTGDTPAAERTAMTKRPPHIVVTTPESLYILLTSEGGRRMLETARTLILDEIHAVVGDKRGSHLALSIERLEQLVRQHSEKESQISDLRSQSLLTFGNGDGSDESPNRNSKSEILAWYESGCLQLNVPSKKSHASLSGRKTLAQIMFPTAPSLIAVTNDNLIWRLNFRVTSRSPSCRAKFGTRSTIVSQN